MFDLITGNVIHAPRPRVTPVIVSIGAHAAIVGAVLVGAVVFVAAPVPGLPMMMAFVAPAPPPPPPPAPLARQPAKQQAAKPVPTSVDAAPMAPPGEIDKAPTLIHRVEPEYLLLAVVRQIEGVVILEGTAREIE